MPTCQEMEAIEMEAWQNMFDIAPATFRKEMNLYYEKPVAAFVLFFQNIP